MADAETKVENAAAEAKEAVAEARAEGTAEAIKAAETQIADAQRTAEQLAAASVNTELGQRIEALKGDFASWRAEIDGLKTELAAINQRLAEPKPAPVIVEAASASRTLPQPTSEEPPVKATEVKPEQGEGGEGPPAQATKRRIKI
jgi:hypothetical protein